MWTVSLTVMHEAYNKVLALSDSMERLYRAAVKLGYATGKNAADYEARMIECKALIVECKNLMAELLVLLAD